MATEREVSLTSSQRSELTSIAQSRSLPAGYVFRAKLILMLAEGVSFNTIKRRLQTSAPTIIRWKQRFLESGLDGLDTYHPGQKATVLTPALRARILSATRKKPRRRFHALELPQTGDRTGSQQGCSASGLERSRPETPSPGALHGQRRSASSKAKRPILSACISGLRSMPPCSASMRKPPSKPSIGSIPFCRFRRDEPSVTASSTTVMARFLCTPPWTPKPDGCTEEPPPATPAATSLPSSKKWSRCARPGSRFISSSTTSRPTKPNWFETSCNSIRASQFHFTPTYSSWLNQVEIWFAKIEREVIARGIFTSVPDLARKLRRYINAYSANARPIRWKYSDPSRRLRTNEFTATVHWWHPAQH